MSQLIHPRFRSLKDQDINVPEQRTPAWFEQRKHKCSGSKLSNFLFVDTHEEIIHMYEEIWEGRKKQPFSEESKGWMQWGTDHEDDAMEKLLDNMQNIVAFEAPFVQHTGVEYLSASPDGFYHEYKNGEVVETGVIEIKTPGKKKKAAQKVIYYYVPQVYLEMSVSGLRDAIFCTWGPKKTTAWKMRWNDKVWAALCNVITLFRNIKTTTTWEQFQLAQFHLRSCCHQACDDAEALHPDKGWVN